MDAKTLIDELIAAGLTQMEIQRRSGLSQSTVSQITTGRRGKRPSAETFIALTKLRNSVLRAARRRNKEMAEAA
ncbi:helix-turn-helix domain-containing protein [Caballeronia sp. AZ7_KS35]|uniref:helix-turn-helix domain-containing protein n=1 Tax=Caballeronia sp. AZ7_KS35 TaxID=2921762 RepID=UPI002028FAAD|nr:helix-turn-helix domain-containing protein [Caballeronia sp. AZ7_KS35]